MTVPTTGECYAKLNEYLRKAQEEAAMLSHLRNAEGDDKGRLLAKGWLLVAEALRLMQFKVTELAKGRLQ